MTEKTVYWHGERVHYVELRLLRDRIAGAHLNVEAQADPELPPSHHMVMSWLVSTETKDHALTGLLAYELLERGAKLRVLRNVNEGWVAVPLRALS